MAAIHHNTTKKAIAHGMTIAIEGDDFVVSKGGVELARAANARDAVDLAVASLPKAAKPKKVKAAKKSAKKSKRKARRSSEDGDDEDEGDEDAGRSLIKEKYRAKYQPNKGHNGDALAKRMRDEFLVENSETGEPSLDRKAFIEFAKANDCWQPKYTSMKGGQLRMNVGNRLRAKVRAGHKVVW